MAPRLKMPMELRMLLKLLKGSQPEKLVIIPCAMDNLIGRKLSAKPYFLFNSSEFADD